MCRAVHPWQAAAIHEWMYAGYFSLRDVHAAVGRWRRGNGAWRISLHGTGCRCLCSLIFPSYSPSLGILLL